MEYITPTIFHDVNIQILLRHSGSGFRVKQQKLTFLCEQMIFFLFSKQSTMAGNPWEESPWATLPNWGDTNKDFKYNIV